MADDTNFRRHLFRCLVLAGVYVWFGLLVLQPFWFDTSAVGRIVWPPSGIALAALALGGLRLWPGVAVGAAITTLATGGSLAFTLLTAAGNTLEAWCAVRLLQRFGFRPALTRVPDVAMLVVAAFACAFISALAGVGGMYVDGRAAASLPRILVLWAMGHAMGSLIVAPVLMTFHAGRVPINSLRRAAEGALLVAALLAVGIMAFRIDIEAPFEYLPFPLLILAAFRFGIHGAALANLLVSGLALSWAAVGLGPFSSGSTTATHAFTWVYSDVTAITALFLGAVVAQSRLATAELERREADYHMLIEQAADGVFVLDRRGTCLDANSSGRRMLQRTESELRDCRLQSFVRRPSQNEVSRRLRALRDDDAAVFNWTMERKDGTLFPVEVSVKRFADGRLQAFIRDATERKSLEDQLLQSQKMEAVGQLAGGVAHEFNNVLTIIQGHGEVARMAAKPSPRTIESIDHIVAAADRAALITRRLLAFARKQPTNPRSLSLPAVVEELGQVLAPLLGETIKCRVVARPPVWPVRADPGQLQQVLINMTLNARDAMPEGGVLTIECDTLHLAADAPDLAAGDYALLRVADSGRGIDPQVLPRIFEPFFTTKQRTERTGLGLAVSYGIVKQAGGDIRVHSSLGFGTTFEILLPRVEDEADRVGDSSGMIDAESAFQGRETLLLIEDEREVRDLAVMALQRDGYTVITAADGPAALRAAEAPGKTLDLVVSDVVLPGASGPETVAKLRERFPDVGVLYISGYPEDRIDASEFKRSAVGFLSKPFKPSELSRAVRILLDDLAQAGLRPAARL